jgi:hypothetical protein
MPHLGLLMLLFAGSTLFSLAATFIVFAMIGEVNVKRSSSPKIPYFRFSWIRVFREYKALYPQGVYTKALVITTSLTCVLFLSFVYMLFVVLPKYALPSR